MMTLDLVTAAFGAVLVLSLSMLWTMKDGAVSSPLIMGEVSGSVRYVVDGDSLYINGYEPQIRLWGVDAPEDDETGFKDATETLKRLALKKAITCQSVETDKYGRTVARCFLKDGREVNAEMITSGTAIEYHHFSKGFYTNRTD